AVLRRSGRQPQIRSSVSRVRSDSQRRGCRRFAARRRRHRVHCDRALMFSLRVPFDLQPNRLAAAVARAKDDNRELIDLTLSNPTTLGFTYPYDLLHGLSDGRSLVYAPEPFGLVIAREAVAADFHRRGVEMSLGRLALTSSTSEAYSQLFKLLCSP